MSRAGIARLTAFACVAVLAGTLAAHRLPAIRPPALRDDGPVPDFALTDQAGRPVTRASLAGSVWVADFIFTRCAGQCPLMSAQMATLQRAFEPLSGVRLVSFTVDPAHDTPEVLAAYARHYGASAARWQFLTGEQEALWRLAREGFKLGVGEGGSTEEPITHSVRLVLVDRRGHIRGTYGATDGAALRRLHQDVRRLLGEPPR